MFNPALNAAREHRGDTACILIDWLLIQAQRDIRLQQKRAQRRQAAKHKLHKLFGLEYRAHVKGI